MVTMIRFVAISIRLHFKETPSNTMTNTKQMFSICKKTGAVVQDEHESIPVFYLASNAAALVSYTRHDEIVMPVSKSRLERAWTLNDSDSEPLETANGIVLATTSKTDAKRLAAYCNVPVSPAKLG